MSGFAELCAATNFSFLRAASHPEEMILSAKALGFAGIGVADRNSLAGVVRAHEAAKEHKVPLLVGARLVFCDGSADAFVYPKDRAAYARLTRLLTVGNRRADKGECELHIEDLLYYGESQQIILAPALQPGAAPDPILRETLERIRARCGVVWLAARFVFDGEDRRRLRILKELAQETGARLIATTEPLHHIPERRALLDVLTCVREKTTLDAAGRLLAANSERCLKSPREMQRLYAEAPEAVSETLRFLQGVTFSLDDLSYEYPDESVEGYSSAQEALEVLSWQGAYSRYPEGVPAKVRSALNRELDIVGELQYAPYFLTVADIVKFAKSKGILCQGRGSAANSSICYCLFITEVNPAINDLLFDRFISTERNEPPDIDVDFEHERREEVIQYVYERYGRHRAALAATLIRYRGRSAIRDVCKVFGYSEDRIAALSRTQQWWSHKVEGSDLRELGLDIRDGRLMQCLALVKELKGFPRHLSQHVGGFVITRENLDDVVPIQNAAMEDRTVVEWDKDDLQALKILKVDILALGMLTCLRKAFAMIEAHYSDWDAAVPGRTLDLDTLPKEDPRVYAMLQRADSLGTFQVESRAQMSMLPRLKPEKFYDLVIEVAIVRPGPIQGGMVHPYLRRKQGLEPVTFPSGALKPVLERTLGVPLFQEQAMQIAIVGAGFSPPEADKLRRAMATFRRVGTIGLLKQKFISGMIANGYKLDFAEGMFRQIEGFGEYGFPESHAASFALLVYASSWVKCHYPDVFAAALLNAQPMGFYAPAQIVRDAQEHGVEVRASDVNHSDWDNRLEADGRIAPAHLNARHMEMRNDIFSTHAVRIGFRQIGGVREDDMHRLVKNRGKGYDSIRDVWLRGGLSEAAIETLAAADCFRSLGLDRRAALWAARGLNRVGGQDDLPLFRQVFDPTREPDFTLPPMPIGEHVVEDYRTLRLSLKTHPAALLRADLAARRAIPAQDLARYRDGQSVRVCGLVLVRQRPGTASGVIFMTLEDETHIANVVVWPRVFERFRTEVLGARLCAVDGKVQIERGVIHVVADRLWDYSPLLARLSDACFENVTASADEVNRPGADARMHPRNVKIDLSCAQTAKVMPKGRNFH
jgi:error-prone DNA polymerase